MIEQYQRFKLASELILRAEFVDEKLYFNE